MRASETVGVIIGRFQTNHLSDGHQELFDYVLAQGHNLNIVVLGKTAVNQPTKKNPLDIDARMRMINETYPGKFVITWIEDCPGNDASWSAHLDKIVGDLANGRGAVLYGSRDSFVSHYLGKYSTHVYTQRVFCSATEIRGHCGKIIHGSPEFRAGVIWATQNQFDRVYPTVDVAVFDRVDDEHWVFLGRKNRWYDGYVFIGGFADPKDGSFEETARREAFEETGLQVDRIQYLGSLQVDDFRYRDEADKIITIFFAAHVCGGTPKASDDIDELHRVNVAELTEEDMAPPHRPLLRMLKQQHIS